MSSRFDLDVLGPDPDRRGRVLEWIEKGLDAVEPERLTRDALAERRGSEAFVIAIGKAAPAMARGAAVVLDVVGGICVSDHSEDLPEQFRLMIGDHPIPGPASLEAGRAVLEMVERVSADIPMVALISGGGSALCEAPRPGVSPEFLSSVNRRLIEAGAEIEEVNLVRAHLSAVKQGGVARAAGRPIDTYLLSDVSGADPRVIASGPTIPGKPDPDRVREIMSGLGIEVPASVLDAMSIESGANPLPQIVVMADGQDAAHAVAATVGASATVQEGWLRGELTECLKGFMRDATSEVNVATGEVTLDVRGDGTGGRNTHAALLAAEYLAGSADLFCAFATDGVDGRSGSAGAIVDGSTTTRGGDISAAREAFDSARYLGGTADLLRCPPTGTNVSDLWILWRGH